MGLVKKASTLFEGLRRQGNNARRSRVPKELQAADTVAEKEEKPSAPASVPASLPRKSRLRPRKAAAVAFNQQTNTMAHTAAMAQYNHDRIPYGAENHAVTEVARTIQLVEDNEDDMVEEESCDEYDEAEDDIDDSVAEDMKRLEESFRGISQKYRLINRIGEGTIQFPRTFTWD